MPKGFTRIRHFGFLANRNRSDNIALCRELLDAPDHGFTEPLEATSDSATEQTPKDGEACPTCEHGTVRCVDLLDKIKRRWLDSS